LLVIGELPEGEDDRNGVPFTGRTGKNFRRMLRGLYRGSVVFDNAVRCSPGRRTKALEQRKKTIIAKCRPYLAGVVQEIKPDRIIVLGSWAMLGVLGRSLPPHSVRRGYGFLSDKTPVFLLPSPQVAADNRFYKVEFKEDLQWALNVDLDTLKPHWDKVRYDIDNAASSQQAIDYLLTKDHCTFDVETAGHMFNPDFEILSIAITGAGDDDSYVWTKRAVQDSEICQQLVELFSSDMGWVAHNIKFDAMAVWIYLGVRIENFVGDTAVWRRLLQANCVAKLEVAAELVGFGGHKEEADVFMAKEIKRVTKAKPGPIDADKLKYVTAIKNLPPRVDKKVYAFGLLPAPVLDRYNALDTLSTSYLHDYLAERLEKKPQIQNVWEKLTKPGLHALLKMEHWGVAADKEAAEFFHAWLTMQMAEIRPHFDQYTDDCFNPDSARDVQDLLFKDIGLHPTKFSEKTGRASADKDVLAGMIGQHPIIEHIIAWRRLSKMDGTYARGMFKHFRADGRMHPTFRIDGTETGRISGSNPNLLNIPRSHTKEGKMAKCIFRATPGNRLVQLDFGQQELRVACALSGDETMAEVFRAGEDLHWFTARAIAKLAWGINPEDVTDAHRSFAKSVIFGLIYGKTDKGLAEQLGITVEEAAKIRKAILGRFVKLRRYIKEMLTIGRRDGGVEIPWDDETVRWRPLPMIGAKADKYIRMKINAENSTINTPVQGRASDYCLASLAVIVDWIEREAVPAKCVLSVYDSIIFDVEPYAVEEVVAQATDIMESWPCNGVPLKVDAEVGEQWGDLQKFAA
jgi:uracil-DNA glycosylase family 4